MRGPYGVVRCRPPFIDLATRTAPAAGGGGGGPPPLPVVIASKMAARAGRGAGRDSYASAGDPPHVNSQVDGAVCMVLYKIDSLIVNHVYIVVYVVEIRLDVIDKS